MIKNFITAVLLFLASQPAVAVGENGPFSQAWRYQDIVQNSGFENGKARWTNSGSGTFAIVTSGANLGNGGASASWTAAANNDKLTSAQQSIPAAAYGAGCRASFLQKGGSSSLTAKVIDGSLATVASQVLTSQTNYTLIEFKFTCPTSSTVAFQLLASGSSAIVYVDDVYIGMDPYATLSQTETLTNKTLSGNTATSLINGSGTFSFNSSGTVTAPNATDTLVGKATTDTLTNKTLNGNTATNLVNGSGTFNFNSSGTLTAPNATDTLVGRNTTDTLTNKTLTSPTITGGTFTPSSFSVADNTFTLQDNGDATKQLQFEASGITTGTTRTLTAPDANTTIVGTGVTQTLTAKTMQGPDGSASTPTYSFSGATNTGLYRNGVTVGLTFAGTEKYSISALDIEAPDGSVSDPVYNFLSDGGMGMYRGSSSALGFAISSTEVFEMGLSSNKTFANFIPSTNASKSLGDSTHAWTSVFTPSLTNGSGVTNVNSTGTITIPNATDTLVGLATTDTLSNKSFSTAPLPSADNSIDLGSSTLRWQELHVGPTSVVFHSDNTNTNKISLSATATGARTVTLPDSTDTLVARATTDTLTNKTLSGNTATNLVNSSGTTNFPASGTITIPAATDTLVGKATTDTLTNKTLTAPVMSSFADFTEIATPATPGAGVVRLYTKSGDNFFYKNSGGTEFQLSPSLVNPLTTNGDIIYGVGSTATRLAASTATTVLHSGSVPSWSAVSLTADVSGTLPTGNGGTNKATWTAGSVPYLTSTTAFAEDNANFFWDGTNHRLGIGIAVPTQMLDVNGSIRSTGSQSQIYQNATGSTADNRLWDLNATAAGVMNFRAIDDANTTAHSYLSVTRSGTAVQTVTLSTTGGNALVANANGTASMANGFSSTPQSRVIANTGNGTGSTKTNIRRFSNNPTNTGTDITYADSSTLGGKFTINTTGLYAIYYRDRTNGTATDFGVSVNDDTNAPAGLSFAASAGTQSITAATAAEITVGTVMFLQANDVIRATVNTTTNLSGAGNVGFMITRVY